MPGAMGSGRINARSLMSPTPGDDFNDILVALEGRP